MANRIVTASVSGETIKLSNKLAGASGSHNAVSLAFTFDSAWDDTTKKVYFFDAYGKNPVYRLLTTDLLVDGAYIVPIPSEPLAHSGDMTIVVRGVEMDDDIIERIIMSANTTMKVAEATTPYNDVAPIEPTPTQAEQLLAAINSITGMTATATELSSGEPASVTKTTNLDGTINLEFGLPAGAKGDAATITVGTTTTGEPGTYASVTNVGTTSAAILNFTIPRGHDGGGLLPQIIVITAAGATVTATSGGKTVSGTAVGGVCTLNIPNYGTWAVSSTLNGQTVSGSVVVDSVKIYEIELQFINVYGFTINEAESDPVASVTYTDKATAFSKGSIAWDTSPLFANIKPCLFKSGAVVGYLQRNDYTKFENGTAADITSGDAGDVMVEIPKMAYYMEKSGDIITCKVLIGDVDAKTVDARYSYLPFSRSAEGDRDKIYIGAYLGYSLSSKLRSLSGKTPTANQTIGAFRTLAQANGTGYQQLSFYPLTLLQILYIMKYGSLDSQTALGRGFVDGNAAATATGGTNSKEFCFGETTGKQQMKIFGIEDFWGNLRQWIDGLYSDSNRTILTTYKSFNDTGSGYPFSNSSGLGTNTGGYMSATQGGTQTGFTLKAVSGSETTYYADYAYLNADCLPYFGGSWTYTSSAGAFRLDVSNSASNAYSSIGARLCYI